MSFGFAIGDVIAVLGLVERIATEVQRFRDAPAHFQDLSAQLHLLDRTLRHVLSLEPESDAQRDQVNSMRAVVLHCQQPLQRFLDRMFVNEKALGHMKYARSFSSVRTRLHWSMIARSDIDELRSHLLSELAAINMLLGVYQITSSSLRILTKNEIPFLKTQLAVVEGVSKATLEQNALVLQTVSATPRAITDLSDFVRSTSKTHLDDLRKLSDRTSDVNKAILSNNRSSQELSHAIKAADKRVKSAVAGLVSVGFAIRELLQLLLSCSQHILKRIKYNTRTLLDIHSMLRRLLRAVEAIPLHLTLPIVRLDDALGESWALPFQACTSWESFKNTLSMVVFANSRPGAAHVALDRFVLFSAKDQRRITASEWTHYVKAGAHVQQAMLISSDKKIVSDGQSKPCPFAPCNGIIDSASDYTCSVCGKWYRSEVKKLDLVHLRKTAENADDPKQHPQPPQLSGPLMPISVFPDNGDSIKKFRQIYTVDEVEPVASMYEAERLLALDANDAAANQYKGWYLLSLHDSQPTISDIEEACSCLEISSREDNTSALTWHLLGEGLLLLSKFEESYKALQQSVWTDGHAPLTWISVGRLYFAINQHMDSLEALARSIRLNPYIPDSWYNLGILYESCDNQKEDALDCYKRCLEVDPDWSGASTRKGVIFELYTKGTDAYPGEKFPMLPPRFYHVRDPRARSVEHDFEYNFAPISDIRLTPLKI